MGYKLTGYCPESKIEQILPPSTCLQIRIKLLLDLPVPVNSEKQIPCECAIADLSR